jgi:ribosome-binding factor A
MSTHAEQVASVIHRCVQELLTRGLNDPRVQGLVSVTKVKVTDDLTEAAIHVSVLPEDRGPTTLKGLMSATGHVRSHISSALRRRRVPRIRFRLDETLKKEARLYEAIGRTAVDDDSSNEQDGEGREGE